MTSVATPLLAVLGVWTILLSGALIEPFLGRSAAMLVTFVAAVPIAVAGNGRWRPTERQRGADGNARQRLLVLALGLAAGFASLPAWTALIAVIGLRLGLSPALGQPAGQSDPALILALVVLAPCFEEPLYRGRLLTALRLHVGAPASLVVTSALFALPHFDAWQTLGTFCVGLALGSVALLGQSIRLCVGLHAGLNLAVIVCGSPPSHLSLPAGTAMVVGAILLGGAFALLQSHVAGRVRLPIIARGVNHPAVADGPDHEPLEGRPPPLNPHQA